MNLFDKECTVIEEIDDYWQKVTKPVTSISGRKRRRTFLRCKLCDELFRCDSTKDVDNRGQLHFCSKARQLSLTERAKPILEYSHFNFVAGAHLSMSQATSQSLYSFYNTSFTYGYNALIQLNPQINKNLKIPKSENFYKPLKRTQFTTKFKQYAEEIEKKCLQTFIAQRYCSIALDAGKVNSLPMLTICLNNPFNKNGSMLYKIVFYFKGNTIDYQNEILDILSILKSQNIIISSFIGDNLKAQTCALKSDIEGSLQKISDDPYIQTIEWMSCCCHTTALGFDDFVASVEKLSDFKQKLSVVVKFFRTKTVVNKINAICPSFCPTRWTNFTDIMLFFINKADIVTDFLVNNQHIITKYFAKLNQNEINFGTFIFQEIASLYWLLIPYKSFINKIEADSFPASYIFPIFENFCSSLYQTAQKASEIGDTLAVTYADSLISFIKLRFENLYSNRFLKMLWFLTPQGRLQARHEYGDQSEQYSEDGNLVCCDMPQLNIDPDEIQNCISDFIKSSKKRIEDIRKAKEKTNKEDDYCDFTDVEDGEIEFEQVDCELVNSEVYDSTLEDVENIVYEKAVRLIQTLDDDQKKNIEKEIGSIEDYPNLILDEFHKWILNGITSPSIICIYKYNPWSFWQEYMHLKPKKQIFADFCLRYLAITASSANCERSFHEINLELTPGRMKSSEELIRYRINVKKLIIIRL